VAYYYVRATVPQAALSTRNKSRSGVEITDAIALARIEEFLFNAILCHRGI
jgi:hypothetical protein